MMPPGITGNENIDYHDDVMTWKRFQIYRPFVLTKLDIAVRLMLVWTHSRIAGDFKCYGDQLMSFWTIKQGWRFDIIFYHFNE